MLGESALKLEIVGATEEAVTVIVIFDVELPAAFRASRV